MPWQPGDTILRREVWRGLPWFATNVIVVVDEVDLLATYIPSGATFAIAADHPLNPHPWEGREAWQGHGVLMLQRPAERYAVWHFWDGAERDFAGWYFNIQDAFRRTTHGFDTKDLELDLWEPVGGVWEWKDDELLDQRVEEGQFTEVEAVEIRTTGHEIAAVLDSRERWWDGWTAWVPDPSWRPSPPPLDWITAPQLAA